MNPPRSGTRKGDRVFVCPAARGAGPSAGKAGGLTVESSRARKPGQKGNREKGPRLRLRFGVPRIFLLGVGMVVSMLVSLALAEAVIESPLFVVTHLDVEEASERVSPEEIRSMSRIRLGTNLVTLDTADVSRRLEAHRWIQHATVVKAFPDRVLIKVRMSKPAAVIGIHGDLYYMDEEGTVLGRIRPGETLDLPVITGPDKDVWDIHRWRGGRDVQQALGLLRVLQGTPALGRVSEIHLDPSEGLSFVLEGFPSPVYVGWSGFSGKTIRFEKILPRVISRAGSIAGVDLRFADQIVIREGRQTGGAGGFCVFLSSDLGRRG